MMEVRYSDIDELIKRVVKEKIEIDLHVEPDRMEVTIRPFKPLGFICPYREENNQ